MTRRMVSLTVNGALVSIVIEPRTSLAEALRTELGLTGTHLGCEHGVCGACTVIVEGDAVRGCLMLAVQAEGCSVTTIEGVSPLSGLSQLQESFRDHHALQCGFCTPGMVLTLHALFGNNPNAGESEIREALSGQLCRCTGYQGIMAAAEAYGKKFRVEQRPNSVQLREAKREKHAS